MVVVSDTSPLTNLAAIGQFDLLHWLFGEIHIADGVWHELNFGGLDLGLHPLGVLGLLLEAKKRGLVEEIRSSLQALRHQAGFYVSDDLYRSVLDMANEAP